LLVGDFEVQVHLFLAGAKGAFGSIYFQLNAIVQSELYKCFGGTLLRHHLQDRVFLPQGIHALIHRHPKGMKLGFAKDSFLGPFHLKLAREH
jgi:hypothetical protein